MAGLFTPMKNSTSYAGGIPNLATLLAPNQKSSSVTFPSLGGINLGNIGAGSGTDSSGGFGGYSSSGTGSLTDLINSSYNDQQNVLQNTLNTQYSTQNRNTMGSMGSNGLLGGNSPGSGLNQNGLTGVANDIYGQLVTTQNANTNQAMTQLAAARASDLASAGAQERQLGLQQQQLATQQQQVSYTAMDQERTSIIDQFAHGLIDSDQATALLNALGPKYGFSGGSGTNGVASAATPAAASQGGFDTGSGQGGAVYTQGPLGGTQAWDPSKPMPINNSMWGRR